MREPAVWIVEMWNDAYRVGRWEPTVGARLTQRDGRAECRRWHRCNPSDKFRLRKYVQARVPHA